MPNTVVGKAEAPGEVAVRGSSVAGEGVRGESTAEMSAPATFGSGVAGINTCQTGKAGPGVYGESRGTGVWGRSHTWHGLAGFSSSVTGGAGVYGEGVLGVIGKGQKGVYGSSDVGEGVRGESNAEMSLPATFGAGVVGLNACATGKAGPGVYGGSRGTGVWGQSQTWHGVAGLTSSTTGGAGVYGEGQIGVFGKSAGNVGVLAQSETGTGLRAECTHGEALRAVTRSGGVAAIAAINENADSGAAAVYAEKHGPQGHAGFFRGSVHVTGDLTLENADCAELFDMAADTGAAPGTVMVVGDDGALVPCTGSYDTRVAGVVSGAGPYRPAIVLDKRDGRADAGRVPIALIGKACALVDAAHGAVRIGDLLTTSPTPGHAMRAADSARAPGTIIGKALAPLAEGRGLVPILITLQ